LIQILLRDEIERNLARKAREGDCEKKGPTKIMFLAIDEALPAWGR